MAFHLMTVRIAAAHHRSIALRMEVMGMANMVVAGMGGASAVVVSAGEEGVGVGEVTIGMRKRMVAGAGEEGVVSVGDS